MERLCGASSSTALVRTNEVCCYSEVRPRCLGRKWGGKIASLPRQRGRNLMDFSQWSWTFSFFSKSEGGSSPCAIAKTIHIELFFD